MAVGRLLPPTYNLIRHWRSRRCDPDCSHTTEPAACWLPWPGQYIPTLEATYPEALCAGIELGTAYLYVGAPDDQGGKYSTPCGISGVGVYELRPAEEMILVGGEPVTASGDQGYSLQDGTFLFEFLFARLREFRFNYGGDWNSPGVTHDVNLADKAVIQQVLASWRWIE